MRSTSDLPKFGITCVFRPSDLNFWCGENVITVEAEIATKNRKHKTAEVVANLPIIRKTETSGWFSVGGAKSKFSRFRQQGYIRIPLLFLINSAVRSINFCSAHAFRSNRLNAFRLFLRWKGPVSGLEFLLRPRPQWPQRVRDPFVTTNRTRD